MGEKMDMEGEKNCADIQRWVVTRGKPVEVTEHMN